LTSTTGILTHPPSVASEAAKLLLSLNYLRSSDILGLQRHEEDAEWEARRKAEIIKRAEGGSAEARAQLQMKVPTRQDDLAHMKLLGDAEEEEMQAYESYRKARNARQVTDQETYDADEEAAMQRRKDWYNSAMQVSRDWGLAKKLNKWRKPKSEEQVRKLVEGHPKRWYPNHKAKNPFDNPRANQGQAQEEELVDDLEEDVEAPTEQAAAAAKQ
jgi:hypothetical protein